MWGKKEEGTGPPGTSANRPPGRDPPGHVPLLRGVPGRGDRLDAGRRWRVHGRVLPEIPQIIPDGQGGAIITWEDRRHEQTDIYAQRLNAAGTPQWAGNGVPVCEGWFNTFSAQIIPDGQGGAIITWVDLRSGTSDIYAQRLDAAGVLKWWPTDVAVCKAGDAQVSPQIIPDGQYGAIITWEDRRSAASSGSDIYAQRLDAQGAPQWAGWGGNGVPVCAVGNDQICPQIMLSLQSVAVITWQDNRSGTNWDIYAKRLLSSGAAAWPGNGVPVCTVGNDQEYPQITSDGQVGTILAWEDRRSGTNYDIYAQRLSGLGAPQWPGNGVPVCIVGNEQEYPQITSDGQYGAIITWEDRRSGTSNIYAQRLDAAGAPQWAGNGVAVCAVGNDQISPQIISDGQGGAVIAWQDYRSWPNCDIYAQRLAEGYTFYFAEGYTGSNFNEWLTLQNPNDAPTVAHVTYMYPDKRPLKKDYPIEGNRRYTVYVNSEAGADQSISMLVTGDAPIVAERPMYFNYNGKWTGGSCVVGATSPASTWFFAEGYTGSNFNEWLTLQNPNDAPINARVTYMFPDKEPLKKDYPIEGNRRYTVYVNSEVDADQSISMLVNAVWTQNGQPCPIVAERPMYFDYNGIWTGGNCVVGYTP